MTERLISALLVYKSGWRNPGLLTLAECVFIPQIGVDYRLRCRRNCTNTEAWNGINRLGQSDPFRYWCHKWLIYQNY